MRIPTIVLYGPPGAGKSTASRAIADTFDNIHPLALGDLVRLMIDSGNEPHASQFRETVSRGELLDDETATELLRGYINLAQYEGTLHNRSILLLDGFPRTVTQAHKGSAFLDYLCLLHFDGLPFGKIRKRIKNRAWNENNGRSDNTADAITHRLSAYETHRPTVLSYFAQNSAVTAIEPRSRPVVEDDVKDATRRVLSVFEYRDSHHNL